MPDWRPRSGKPLLLRLGLHSGIVTEDDDLGRKTNIWGVGINTAARILGVSAARQLLVSKQYFDNYIAGQRESDFEIGSMHWRTVKHGVGVEVMNMNRQNLCLNQVEAENRRWQAIGGLWQKTIQNYTYLIQDAMKSGDPVAALASAKFLVELNAPDPVHELCQMIGRSDNKPNKDYPPQHHILFSQMPPDLLFKVIEISQPRLFKEGETIFEVGDPADSCFFPVSGSLVVELPDHDEPIPIPKGQMTGEFTLWIPGITRTAKVVAQEDGLMLKIPNRQFKEFLDQTPDVANVIYGIIRQRIVENVLTSARIFPSLEELMQGDLHNFPAVCSHFKKGETIDIKKTTCILFNGKVSITPEDGIDLEVTAFGNFGNETVVGIVSDIGSPDGLTAIVLEDTVAVIISHDVLEKTLEKSGDLMNAWNAICGQRLGSISRAKKALGK